MVRAGTQNVLGLGNMIETRQNRTRNLKRGTIQQDLGLSRNTKRIGASNVIEARQNHSQELELGMIDEDLGLSRGLWSQSECKMYWL